MTKKMKCKSCKRKEAIEGDEVCLDCHIEGCDLVPLCPLFGKWYKEQDGMTQLAYESDYKTWLEGDWE